MEGCVYGKDEKLKKYVGFEEYHSGNVLQLNAKTIDPLGIYIIHGMDSLFVIHWSHEGIHVKDFESRSIFIQKI